MWKSLLLPFLIAVSLTGAPAGAANVAIIMSADVGAYREALQGFRATIDHRVVGEYDMVGDFDRGREILTEIKSKMNADLILAVGLWALQVIVGQPADVPVVYTMVLNPQSIVGPEMKNITGASMNIPVQQSIRLLKQLGPQIRRIGVIFSRAKTGYLVEQAELVAREEGLQVVAREIHSPKEAIEAVKSLWEEGVDALWILPDATVLDPKVVRYTLLFSYRNKIPVLAISERQAKMGALLALSFASSEDIGRQAGELANGILGGRPTEEFPYTTARQVKLTVNLKAARKLGIEIPGRILAMANTVIQ